MTYLIKPRGRGYSFRMVTPEILVGTENPWTGKPFGKGRVLRSRSWNEIRAGLARPQYSDPQFRGFRRSGDPDRRPGSGAAPRQLSWTALSRPIQREGHVTLRAVAEQLNTRGIQTRRGGNWQMSNVRNLLARRRNVATTGQEQ